MFKGLQKAISPITKYAGIGPATGGNNFLWGSTFTWMGWNKTAQLQGGYGNKIVYSYANVLVNKLIEVPFVLYLIKDEIAARKLKTFNFGNNANITGKYNVQEIKALEEIRKHPLIQLMEFPNPYQTGIEMMEAFWFNYVISGDGYIWAEKIQEGKQAGEPAALHCIPSNLVQPIRQLNDINAPIEYYQFTTWQGTIYKIYPADMLHLAQWSPFDPVLGGYSPLVPGAKSIATNEANQEAQGRAFMNGSTGIIIHSDVSATGSTEPYDKLTKEQVNNIKETLALKYQGATNNQMTHVTNGYVGVVKLGDTLADLQLCEAEKANWKDGGALFGVSPILVGDMSGGTENNVAAAYRALVLNNAIPKLRKFDQSLKRFTQIWYPNEKLQGMHDVKKYTELSPDQKLMKEVFGDADFLTQNEKRRLFSFDDDNTTEGMNTYLVSSSKKTLEQIVDGNFTDSEPDKSYPKY